MTRRARAAAAAGLALRLALGIALGLALGLALAFPPAARAAFELRDASPEALGAVSADLPPEARDDAGAGGSAGAPADPSARWSLGASRASLYGVEGLSAERAFATLRTGGVAIAGSWGTVGVSGLVESSVRSSVTDASRRAVRLTGSIERLALSIEGAAPAAGWTATLGAIAERPIGSMRLVVGIAGDRLARSRSLEALGVGPAAVVRVRLEAPGVSIAAIDRRERDGRRSPRVVADFELARAARLRVGRGASPGRVGVALSCRVRGLEVACGRQDDAGGGSIASVGLRLRAGRTAP